MSINTPTVSVRPFLSNQLTRLPCPFYIYHGVSINHPVITRRKQGEKCESRLFRKGEPMTKLPPRIRIGDHVYLENMPVMALEVIDGISGGLS